jgi:AmmeMemoRadiSam system protein A
MAASPSTEILALDEQARALLLDIADAAVVAGLDGLDPPPPDLDSLPPVLREPSGVFVTLLVRGELNGCVGNVSAGRPLALGVARYARAAAFEDPRLPPLHWRDYDFTEIEVSVLSPLTPIEAGSRAELLAALRPGVDGLYLSSAGRASVFLPVVWEQLPDPDDFVRQLQHKAGLAPERWPSDMAARRFTAVLFGRAAGR